MKKQVSAAKLHSTNFVNRQPHYCCCPHRPAMWPPVMWRAIWVSVPLKALLCIFFFFTDSQSLRCLNVDVANSVAKQAGVRLMEHLRANRILDGFAHINTTSIWCSRWQQDAFRVKSWLKKLWISVVMSPWR